MWAVFIYAEGGNQYEYSVIPENPDPTMSQLIDQATKAHILNATSGVIGNHRIHEIIIVGSQKFEPSV